MFSYWEYQTFFEGIDLVVIGSGIVGLNAALEFKTRNPNAKVVVLERGILPDGASLKNAGFACYGSLTELADDLKSNSEDLVWKTVELRYQGIKKLQSIIPAKDMHYEPCGGFELFETETEFDKYQSYIAPFNKHFKSITGVDNNLEVVDDKIAAFKFGGTKKLVKSNIEGLIDTGKMMRTLMHLCYSKGIIILTNVTVKSISTQGNQNTLYLSINDFQFDLIPAATIIATNGFAKQLLPELDVKPARAQVIVTSPIHDLAFEGGFHYQSGYYYFRHLPNKRILFGGGRNLDFKTEETYEKGSTTLVQNKLKELLHTIIIPNQAYTIDYSWSGTMGVGAEKMPIVKKLNASLVCAVRMGGMGVAIGSIIGEKAVDCLEKE